MKNITIPHLWKQEFSKNKNAPFIWDNILGMQTKKEYTLKAYFIAGKIKNLPGDKIGVMMPAISGASLLVMAIYLAGKTPVMFNWTLGKDGFDHCVKFSGVESIVTVGTFYERVKNDFLEKHNNKGMFLFLEEMLKNGSILEKGCAFVKSLYMPISGQTHRSAPTKENVGVNLGVHPDNNTAVILFTSGSESLPKAVPLTHKNIIEDITGALEIFTLGKEDVLLGFLPPFHSFGFTVNTIMPLIKGIRVGYTPDPNDAMSILQIIKHTRTTAITATPTFLKMIMSLASREDLKTLKYAVVGAEKCPDSVFKKFAELCPDAKILEGYGITECSPAVSLNPIDNSKPGTVGKVISCLDCKIIDIDTSKECKTGGQGMIYLSGESIFTGYLDKTIESPFEEIDGKQYYKTGDLGFLDADGFLSITGRLKRFVKIAGEMMSLPFVEGVLTKKYNTGDELEIALEAVEKDGEAEFVLFSIKEIDLTQVNTYMRENGVPNLVKISRIELIGEIPVLGTGKTDYKALKKMI